MTLTISAKKKSIDKNSGIVQNFDHSHDGILIC